MDNSQELLSCQQEAIVALCTPSGAGAIGLIRISGINALRVVDEMSYLPGGQRLSEQKTHTIHFGYVIDMAGEHIDQVLFLLMKAPKTFTGQDTVEITCHNNQFLIDSIIGRAIACGARLAGGGEFTQRAVMNGKMDLLQAEAMHDLIHAQTVASLKYSLQGLEGSLSSWIKELEMLVVKMLAFCEASFEFLDEEMEFVSDIQDQMEFLLNKVKSLIQSYSQQQYIKEGIRIALVGSVNAGKSSLFNALLSKQRAIVSDIAGTTRDVIEAGVYKWGTFITFVDTAGIRLTDNVIEQQGIDRSFGEVAGADIILLVVDGSAKLSLIDYDRYSSILQEHGHKAILVYNKADLGIHSSLNFKKFNIVSTIVSSKQKETVDDLYDVIHEKIEMLQNSGSVTYLLNHRQYVLLSKFLEHLEFIKPMLYKKSVDYELLSHALKESLQLLCEVTGRSVSQATLDQVFKSFCVGK